MQAEDIIQQKSWTELTAADKLVVEPLASTEEEYNLLKNILQVAVEDEEPVPAINASIYQHLQNEVKANNKKPKRIYYYAVASVFVVLITSWFVFRMQDNKPDNNVAVVPKNIAKPADMQNIVTTIQPVKEDVLIITESEKIDKKSNNKKKPAVKNIQADNNNLSAKESFRINTFINSDSEMMAVITEVY